MRSLRMALTPEHVAQAHRVLEDPGPDPTWTYFTVAHLEEQGIRDRNLWRLQALVAERIKPNTSDPPDRAASPGSNEANWNSNGGNRLRR